MQGMANFPDEFNEYLHPLIGTFDSVSAAVRDTAGNNTPTFSAVIHCSGRNYAGTIPIDDVAAVVDFHENLTIKTLATAYSRARELKSLEKIGRKEPEKGNVSMTTVLVVAAATSLTLERIAHEMQRLNSVQPSSTWPDAVAVLGRGIVNYTAEVPGLGRRGDFFLPARVGPSKSHSPSLYIQMAIRSTGDETVNKIASLVMARVGVFDPENIIPNFNDLLTRISPYGVVPATYQFDLSYQLSPISPQQTIATLLPQPVFNIISRGKKLGSIQFLDWQDGGVIVVRDGFPIDLFLVFAKMVVPAIEKQYGSYFKQGNLQISFVLPLNREQFHQILMLFQQRSANISVIPETAKFMVQKIEGEGSNSPFLARFMLSILTVRDAIYLNRTERDKFDELYDHVLSGLRTIRESQNEIANIWTTHAANITNGSIVSIQGRQVTINESIDRALRREFEAFVNSSARTLKHSLQSFVTFLGFNIGFLFGKFGSFQSGATALEQQEPLLAAYLRAARQWSEPLILIRNDLEHGTVDHPKVRYEIEKRPVAALEPLVKGKPITAFTEITLNQIMCFTEELVVHCLKLKLPQGLSITETPLSDRNPECPERFNLTVTPGGRPIWTLTSHNRAFEQV
jgi:hypothetical protein